MQTHDLRYGIFAGSLIGAVRHKGFIPWDDDMDVLMPRPTTSASSNTAATGCPNLYEFVCAENDPEYPLPFGKIQDASTTLIEAPPSELSRRHLCGRVPVGCRAQRTSSRAAFTSPDTR